MILLTPGPCMTSDTVRAAAAEPDVNHRDPDYLGVQTDVRRRLSQLGQGYVPYLVGGSGTAAMEAMVSSCIEEGPCLIVTNGYYAERFDRIFAAHEIVCETVWFPWTQAWDMRRIEEKLDSEEYEAVLAVHHETSTGRLNPIGELAQTAKKYGTTVLVDAVSSLGAEPFPFEGVHAVFSSANKCLHGLPGVSFVLLEPSFSKRIESFPQRSYYLHLPMYAGERPPLTPPTVAVRAFRQALVEFESQGGVAVRHERYARQASCIRGALTEIGCGFLTPHGEASCAVTVAMIPRGFVADTWQKANYDAGFVLFECKGDFRETHFQVSTMGEVTDAMVDEWLNVVGRLTSRG